MNTVTIFNMALSSVGTRAAVSSPEEDSREAEICRTWYTTVRDHVLRAAYWPSTRAHARLALLAERDFADQWTSADPDPTYLYAYGVPVNMLSPRYLSDYSTFVWGLQGNTTSALMTNAEDAILVYTLRQEDPNKWDSSLQLAIAFALGAFICRPLTGKTSMAREMRQEADKLILDARTASANTNTQKEDSLPEWYAARGTALAPPTKRFFYPYSSLLMEQGATDVQ